MTSPVPAVPHRVLDAFGFVGRATPLGTGLINDTYLVRDDAGTIAGVVQRLHPVFAGEVNIDIDAVTTHLAHKGVPTPRIIRSNNADRWVVVDDRPWRALTYVGGIVTDSVESVAHARAAGELVGRFHNAVADLHHKYVFTRAGVHDTTAHLNKLRDLVRPGHAATNLANDILRAAAALPTMPSLPLRHTHGDLKISNIVFESRDPWRARSLIDLDTVGLQTIAYELGDALRSWCNPRGEDTSESSIDIEIYRAALKGYASAQGGLLSDIEWAAIPIGLETVCIELAARFCADAFEDTYFGWDSSRFPSRVDHNLVRARGQLALGKSVHTHRPQLII